MDSKANSTSTTLKSNPLINNNSTAVINNSNIDPKFLLSNFESNRDFHFFTDSQGNTFTTRDIPSQQSLIHNWMLPIFSLPTPPQPHHLSIQNTSIFMNQH
ncbi:unnamed protein product [Rhizophagus irregularis]|uniref:Uncharacterized protein n=1 Tax=Rhizophagus irregularis TaxID=588596 RepID=A0A915YN74_9GLOM|nr:unnamed protein product [Rhizophagus irregularis]